MFATIADLFGYVLNFIYDIIQNYGIAIILFTILLKIVWLPISIWQQKSMRKSARIQQETNKLQVKYKNDQEKLNQEIMALYKREKTNPLSGCVGAILQFVIFISVFYLVSSPLTYMKKLDDVYFEPVSTVTEQEVGENNSIEIDSEANQENEKKESVIEHYINELNNNEEKSSYPEIKIIEKYGQEDEKVNLNMEFLGLNLSKVPQQNFNDLKVFIIPLLYVIVTFINIKISSNMTKTKNNNKEKSESDEQLESMQQMTNSMNYMMPIMSIAIAIIAPLGLSLYWLVSNILQLIEKIIVDRVMDKKEEI